ncbi:hypothetical protein [Streptomyces sp. RFCAC02]|uniref:hypothetical protein n=1 Tax=Streptomyces sp. RFCAC02 TaxID=2499143 RepID=UPI001021143D|nr:hypothetical protein [Streptomyces sp. RFCAC02]
MADALPNSFDLPDGWLLAALPVTTIATLNHDSGTLSGPQATVSYTDDAGMTADVTLYALDNTEIAQVLLEELALSSSDGSARPLDLPAIGDGSFAYETGISRPQPRFVVVRTGATIALVSGRGEEGQPFDIGHLEQLARLVSDRVRTARTP